MEDMLKDLSTDSAICWERRMVAVRTVHGARVAEKLARLALLEEDVRPGELIISVIYNIGRGAARWFSFRW